MRERIIDGIVATFVGAAAGVMGVYFATFFGPQSTPGLIAIYAAVSAVSTMACLIAFGRYKG